MSKSKADSVAVSTYADHEVILPPNKLKKAVAKVKPGEKEESDPVARAEAALAELSSEFATWMESECERLDAAHAAVRQKGMTAATRDDLFRAAHDIKGQAETFGFGLVAPVAESLCRLIEHSPEMTRIPLALVAQHVDAVRAIVHHNARGNAEMKAKQLGQTLRRVTDEFLRHENRDRPDYLEGLLAPPIAPG